MVFTQRMRNHKAKALLPLSEDSKEAPNQEYEKHIADGIQCPYIGTVTDKGQIGCLIYHNQERESEERQQFFTKTCSTFYCTAWHMFPDEEILFAAELFQDWYYYSILINDTVYLKDLYKK